MSSPNPTTGGPPLRALAMVLIALAIVFAGLGAMSLSNSDSGTVAETPSSTPQPVAPASTAAPRTTAPTSAAAATTGATSTTATSTTATATTAPSTTSSPAATTTAAETTPAGAVNRAVPVRVLNNSLVAGLAATTAAELTANGWTNVSPGNYSGGTIAKTTVFYGNTAGEREAAQQIASELGISAEPKTAGIDGTGVVVILTGN
ncbi:LytR C-terminal domain-containing protein [Nocardia sp. NPDC127579]|uniref:LytR C-terminal domain-containing protein n=1 Tax=Nocardia sp. NPDC127579 TaxID=3345402 RepID=UPI0036335281